LILRYFCNADDEGEANVPRVGAAAAHAHGGEEEGNRVTESVKKRVVQKVNKNAKTDKPRKKSRKVKKFEIEVSEDEEEEGKGDVRVNVPGSGNKQEG
jgi:hypothetical protein